MVTLYAIPEESHFLPIKPNSYGGSVTMASMLQSARYGSSFRLFPWMICVFMMQKTLVHVYVAAVHSMEFLDRSRGLPGGFFIYLMFFPGALQPGTQNI